MRVKLQLVICHDNDHEETVTNVITLTLLLDSGVLCLKIARGSQYILRPLKNKGFQEERATEIGQYDIGNSTTLESNKSPGEMVLWRIWHPTYGVIYDEATAIKRGHYERRRERDPTERGHRHPLWAPA